MLVEPDYTQTVWPTLEEKLGRKMSEDENRRLMYRGGAMFKEWFFNSLEKCTTPEQAEDLLARALQRPWPVSKPAPRPSLLSRVLNYLFG
jgi:hypothetical protein